jgi:basic amino acid/polyamine antiporter, APA family
VIALRFREPARPRPFTIPLSVPFRGASLPVPAVIGAIVAAAGWLAVIVYHAGARYVGFGWLAAGVALYVVYRKVEGKPLLKRVTIPERALRHETLEPEFGSILVPIFGSALDDDIVQTAGRLAGETRDDLEEEGAMIEAVWVFEMPLSLPLEAPLPEAQIKRARQALARAKQVGEEYEGVQVATAMVRARRAGQAVVSEARRRGVEAIVLAAEEQSRVRGGALLGGIGPLENAIGTITKYVISKAPCRVILTAAPPAGTAVAGPAEQDAEPGLADVNRATAGQDDQPGLADVDPAPAGQDHQPGLADVDPAPAGQADQPGISDVNRPLGSGQPAAG